jgi:hypothetical protein
MPHISTPFPVQCPDCGVVYSYRPEDVLKVESTVLESFTPHPLFQDA